MLPNDKKNGEGALRYSHVENPLAPLLNSGPLNLDRTLYWHPSK
jgi:hypothetical protein